MVWLLVVGYLIVSAVCYVVLFREMREARRVRTRIAERLSSVTAPPLYTLDRGEPAAVVDDGPSPLSSTLSEALDW